MLTTLAVPFVIAAALSVSGCATPKVAPPSPELRGDLKVLGFVTPEGRTLPPPDEPVKGTGAAALTGAGQGAAGTFLGTAGGFCQGGGPYACAVGIVLGAVLAPVGAVIGAGVGASKAHSAEEVERAQKLLVAVLAKSRPNAALAQRFTELASDYDVRIVPITCEKATSGCRPKGDETPKYALHIGYSTFDVRTFGRIDPDLGITATVDVKIFKLVSGEATYERQWGYKSDSKTYFALAKDGGSGLSEMIAASHKTIASIILHDLYAAKEPSPIGRRSKVTVWTKSGPLVKDTPKPGPASFQENAPTQAVSDDESQPGDYPELGKSQTGFGGSETGR